LSQCDVSNETQVQATVEGALSHFSKVNVIINNAGLMNFKPIEQQTGEDWLRIPKVDLLGAFFL
jgi:NAD(P)-dependent dehydrogenase (short-subunit alcohol dehydrogenase family)